MTRDQRIGAALRALFSLGTAVGAIIFAAIGGLIAPPLMYVGAIGFYVLMVSAAWRTGEFKGRKQLDLATAETKQTANERIARENESK